jgi:Skp family chaperone for outer membrane proteins
VTATTCASRQRTRPWTRRRALGLAVGAAVASAFGPVVGPARAQSPPPILTVSRQRLLNETRYARALARAEQRMTAELQSRIDATKRELTEREQELARQRGTLPQEEFEALTAAFDRRVRRERREAQRLSSELQTAFRNERVKLLEMLDGFLEQVRAERGASLILNQDDAIASDPALDITEGVIARFDQAAKPPQLPDLESLISDVPEPAEAPD